MTDRLSLHTFDLTDSAWKKSSYSDAGAQCVEVAGLPGGLAVRDSKDPALGALRFTAASWAGFRAGL
jgi:hypothetical protein